MSQFAVVQDEFTLDDWQATAWVLAEGLGLHPTTAKQRARKAYGFLAEDVDDAVAERVRQACTLRKVAVRVIPEEDVVPLLKPTRVHEVWFTDDALWLRPSHVGPRTSLPWDHIALIAAYQSSKTESYRRWSTGSGRVGLSESEVQVSKYAKDYVEHIADIVGTAADGSLLRLRLGSREVNFHEGLAEIAAALPDVNVEDDATLRALRQRQARGADPTNPHSVSDMHWQAFRVAVVQILTRALRAYVPPETLAVLNGPTAAQGRRYELSSMEEFDGYTRWVLQQMRLRGALPLTAKRPNA